MPQSNSGQSGPTEQLRFGLEDSTRHYQKGHQAFDDSGAFGRNALSDQEPRDGDGCRNRAELRSRCGSAARNEQALGDVDRGQVRSVGSVPARAVVDGKVAPMPNVAQLMPESA